MKTSTKVAIGAGVLCLGVAGWGIYRWKYPAAPPSMFLPPSQSGMQQLQQRDPFAAIKGQGRIAFNVAQALGKTTTRLISAKPSVRMSATEWLNGLRSGEERIVKPQERIVATISTLAEADALTDLFSLVPIQALAGDTKGKAYADTLLALFTQTAFVVSGELFAQTMGIATGYSNLPLDMIAGDQKTADYFKHLGCMPKNLPSYYDASKRSTFESVVSEGRMFIVERALAKASNFYFTTALKPELANLTGPSLTKAATALATPILTAIVGGAAAVPVAGWITAALAAAIAAVIGIVDFVGAINRREEQNLRLQAEFQDRVVRPIQTALREPVDRFLGQKLNMVSLDPPYSTTEGRIRAPYLRNFCLMRGGPHAVDPCAERVFPQVPFFARQINHKLVVGVAPGWNGLYTITPYADSLGFVKKVVDVGPDYIINAENLSSAFGSLGLKR